MSFHRFLKKYLFIPESKLVLGSLLFVSAVMFISLNITNTGSEPVIQPQDMLSDPAAAYCQEMGFRFEIVDGENGQEGVCHFSEDQSCPAWDFLGGTCGQEHSFCAQQGYGVKVKHDGKDPFSPSYAVCVDKGGVELNSVTDMFSLNEKALGCGGDVTEEIPDMAVGETAYTPDPDVALPASFDWRNNGGDWTTTAKHQGNCGSCWAFAAVGVTEAVINIEAGDPTLDLDLSEQYLNSDCYQEFDGYGTCCGGRKSYALAYIRDNGIPDEGCFAYQDGAGCSCNDGTCDGICTYNSSNQCSDTTCSDRCPDYESRLEYITDYGYVGSDPATIKQALIDHGPLAVSVNMNGNFYEEPGGSGNYVYRCDPDSPTNHAVAIVGYDDVKNVWIVRNSWGATWHDGTGHFQVGYGECSIEDYVYYASAETVTAPANDDMADAIEITPASLPYTNTQTTTGATLEPGEPYSYCAPGSGSVWYSFTPSSTGLYEVDTLGSGYDTVLNVYDGSYDYVTCNDDEDISYTFQSRTVFQGVSGTTYYISIKETDWAGESPGEEQNKTHDQPVKEPPDQGVDGIGGSLTLHLDSYSCPADALCVTVLDEMGLPLSYPELYAFTGGGNYVDSTYSTMAGYAELDGLSAGSYDVDIAGRGVYMAESGWSLGYHHTSAVGLPSVSISAKDKNNPSDFTIDGDIYIRRSGTNSYGGYVGWFWDDPGGSGNFVEVFLPAGSYDIEIKDWYDEDYLLAAVGQVVSGGETIILDAYQLGYDTLTINRDPNFDEMYINVEGLMSYYYFYAYSNPQILYVSNGLSSYSVQAALNIDDGADTWYYYLYGGCDITGAPGVTQSCNFGGTFSTSLSTIGAPFYAGNTGWLETTTQDGYGNTLNYVDYYDADGSAAEGEKIHPDPRLREDKMRPPDSSIDQAAYYTAYPEFEVRDSMSTLIPGARVNPWYDSPYEFDIPDPANTGTWQGDVTVDLGPYQADVTDTVTFGVFEQPSKPPATDFDGDWRSDPAKFYPSTGTAWWLESSTDSWDSAWLGSGVFDYVPYSDFDGDGMTDPGKFTAADGTVWYIQSSTGAWEGIFLGVDPYTYVAGNDFDGDGVTDPTKLLPNGAIWYPQSSTGVWEGFWVGPEDFEYVAGSDFDGDGMSDPAKFIADPGVLWYYQSTTSSWVGVFLGSDAYDYVSASDFDGDGMTDPAKFYAGTDTVWWLKSTTGTWDAAYMGGGSYSFVGGNDFDGDGVTDPAKYDPAAGTLSWLKSSTGTWDSADLGTDAYELVN